VPAVHHGDLGGELGQEGGLLHGGVAAAHHDHAPLAEEGRVADRAVGDATALQRALAGQAELARGGAGGDDDRPGAMAVRPRLHDVRLAHGVGRELHARDVVGLVDRAEALGLSAHALHELRAEDALGEAGVVVDVRRDHELAAGTEPLDHERRQVGAGGVEGGRVPGRPAADDQEVVHVVAHRVRSGLVVMGCSG
jgi:hypothetical protein